MGEPLVTAASIKLKDIGAPPWGSATQLASRKIAVAGSAIQFDAGETDVDLFRNRLYVWDFGDTGSGTWQDGKSQNSDVGPIAGHVYETPGSYDISCSIFDASGLIITINDTVMITDPDIIYAGTLTTCVSTGVDFTGAPAGATLVTTTDLATIGAYIGTGKRLLFKRGDTWTGDAGLIGNNFVSVDDVYISAFGTGTSPDEVGIFSNDPEFTVTGVTGSFPIYSINKCSRWVISHQSLIGPSTVHSWTGGNTDLVDITYLKTKTEGFFVPMGTANAGTQGHIGLAYVSGKINNADGNALFTGSEKLLLLGNIYTNARTSHVVRVWHGYHWTARHNNISGSSLDNLNGRQLLKHHGPKEDKVIPAGPWVGDELRTHSEYSVISDNVFGAGGPFPLNCGPQDTGSDERLKAIIIENNRSIGDFGQNSTVLVTVAIRMIASNSVVRNNVIDTTGMNASNVTAVSILNIGVVAQREDNYVYNNTVYLKEGNTYGNQADVFVIGDTFLNAIIKNNLSNLPASASPTPIFIADDGTGTVQSSNLITADPMYTDVNNVDPLLRDFSVTVGSPAIGAGEDVPVFQDIDGNPRISGSYDAGAYQE